MDFEEPPLKKVQKITVEEQTRHVLMDISPSVNNSWTNQPQCFIPLEKQVVSRIIEDK